MEPDMVNRMDVDDLKYSIRAINLMIRHRQNRMYSFVRTVVGNEGLFIKPTRDPLPRMEKALAIRKEINKLRKIRDSLQIALKLQTL